MYSLYWIGKYESDIEFSSIFYGSITYYGSNHNNNYSFCKNNIRINAKLLKEYKSFVLEMIGKIIRENKNCKFMYYDQVLAQEIIALRPEYSSYIIGINTVPIIHALNNKLYNRMWMSNIMDTIPVKIFDKNECTLVNLQHTFKGHLHFVIQKNISAGGRGTYLLSKDSENEVLSQLEDGELYLVSPYISKSYSVNVHVCISDSVIIYFPPSIQITNLMENKLLFYGSDFIAANKIQDNIKNQLYIKVDQISNLLKNFGYRGILGIDFIITDNNIYFVEINPRFQGSSPVLNKCLTDNKLPSLQELHLNAFYDQLSGDLKEKIENGKISYSLLIYRKFSQDNNLLELYTNMKRNHDLFKICNDGYQPAMHTDCNAFAFRVFIKNSITYINPDNRINIVENLMDNNHLEFPIKNSDEIITLKISLLIQGVRISKDAYDYISKDRAVKNATFNAVDVTIFDGLKVNCPIEIPFVNLSPYHIEYDLLNGLQLYCKKMYISKIEVDTNENILERKTISGIPYSTIGFRTNDRVRIRHTSLCCFKEQDKSCSFCENKNTKKYNFSDADIYEVIDAYEKEVPFRHYLIGGGSEDNDLEPIRIKKIIQYIRKISDKPIYLMSLPPKDISHIYDYYQLGLTEAAFNLEVYDREIAAKLMPGKGKIPLTQYLDALEESTKYLGTTGNVRSMFIVGLEPEKSLLEGVKKLCSLGVSPMLSVFRPMPLSTMKDIVPPTVTNVKQIYKSASELCKNYGLFLGPACEHCQNNTLSLSPRYLEIK